MARVYKTFLDSDITSTRTLLHEVIPMTGTILSGTYGLAATALGSEPHVKSYAHGMFTSIYDYPHLSSSANQIMDITVGCHTGSKSFSGSLKYQAEKKLNMYTQMAQILMGYDAESVNKKHVARPFDRDGNLAASGAKFEDAIFISFSRLLTKDEIKKGSFSMEVGLDDPRPEATAHPFDTRIKLLDSNAETQTKVNSPAGEYALLYAYNVAGNKLGGAAAGNTTTAHATPVGLIFYQAGMVVLSGSLLLEKEARGSADLSPDGSVGGSTAGAGGLLVAALPSGSAFGGLGDGLTAEVADTNSTTGLSYQHLLVSGSMADMANFIRQRIYKVSFNNTTELNSSIYFCRANHNEFNFSSNRTYLSSSKIRVKGTRTDMPRSYITTVGLYSADNELMAVAKLSEPLRKDPTNEVTLRVRLDY